MEFYHVLNRGVDKRDIFTNDKDRFRFIHNLYEFNDEDNRENTSRIFQNSNLYNIGCRTDDNKKARIRKCLVYLHAFCLMPNHYHLFLSPKIEGGISKFMQKLNMGYSKYFNIKYDRQGALFQGKYKSILVEEERHFDHLPHYIHLNPLDLVAPEWRDGKINNHKKALQFLENYRWSSLLDYTGKKNFPSIICKQSLTPIFKWQRKLQLEDWIKDLDLVNLKTIMLE